MPEHRFPPPWTAEETDACFTARDGKGPTVLRLVEGQPFRVESKHLAGFMVFSALARVDIEHAVGTSYRLAFDPDPTKIDWGLATRTQATHFSRINSQAIVLPDAHKP